MKLKRKYLDAIDNQDTLRLQRMLVTIIYLDKGFNTNRFDSTWQEIRKSYPQIICPHAGIINLDKKQWDENYYYQALAELRGIFSQERINHVTEVGQYLYGQENNINIAVTEKQNQYQNFLNKRGSNGPTLTIILKKQY